jgi:hypothetical protein
VIQAEETATRNCTRAGKLAQLDENIIAAIDAKRREPFAFLDDAKAKHALIVVERFLQTRYLQSNRAERGLDRKPISLRWDSI